MSTGLVSTTRIDIHPNGDFGFEWAICTRCRRADFYLHALVDGWSLPRGVTATIYGKQALTVVYGLCWRCFRDDRANQMSAAAGTEPEQP